MICRKPTTKQSSFPKLSSTIHAIFPASFPKLLPCCTEHRAEEARGAFHQEQRGSFEQRAFMSSLVVFVTSTETATTVQFYSGVHTELSTAVLQSQLEAPDIAAGQTW